MTTTDHLSRPMKFQLVSLLKEISKNYHEIIEIYNVTIQYNHNLINGNDNL